MKVAYSHLINFIPSRPTIDEISQKFFQLGHEHEIEDNIFNMELTPNRRLFINKWFVKRFSSIL